MSSRGCLFIVSAPAGTGKTTLVARLTKELPAVVRSISTTTRKKRHGEEEGVDYFFVSKEKFEEQRQKGAFLEWVELFGCLYGTSQEFVNRELQKGHHVILVIDTVGAMQVLDKIAAVSIFISPPSLAELRRRLQERKSESAEKVEERLARAEEEIAAGKSYAYQIVNDDLETAINEVVDAIDQEQ